MSCFKQILNEYGSADLVVANNVFAHSDNLIDIISGIERILNENGIFVFEVSYLADIVDKFLFDTVYHEHVSYHSINPLQKAFANKGLEIFNIIQNRSKGGSIRCFVKRIESKAHNVEPIVQSYIQTEQERGLDKRDIFIKYNNDILKRKEALNKLLDQLFKRWEKDSWLRCFYHSYYTDVAF